MLQVERMSLILAELNANGRVMVNGLAEQLEVSKVTIRRDLELLSQDNKLLIVHGGAIKPNFRLYEAPFNQRHDINIEEKIQVGKKAVDCIQDNDVIAFGVGTTTLQIAKHVQNKHNLTIIVSCVSILNQLIERKKAGVFSEKIIFLGGEIDTDQMFATGSMMLDMLDRLYIDKVFIGASGYSIVNGITTYNIEEGNFLKRLINRSREVYLVIDHTKIEAKSLFKYTEFNDVDYIICDSNPPTDWKKPLENGKVQWIKA
ncbi:DeoR/GlpR family DNA-binding transcription regulator [Paenibacillus sp. OV219]|uniref:DeoR/GlpR family DNA-binding transcription regulator n=1 Tax=Paenibacillus sp. OV219 TaxID=1884377 RepID=UPI0008D2D63D|nr:DeoR/GlpR family DNA-binding transcription regulator [Paenibacillus sp. OV219]SEO52310.1 transcriptional regulator, DeoR family [Paenibacillus sp. OV219]